jgi:regulatory protein
MYVSEIIPFRRSKSRSKVCLDDGTGFVLYNKEIHRFEIEAEKEISDETFQEILKEIYIPRAKKKAMHLLEEQDRTTVELEQKLKDSGYPKEAIQVALDYVASYHYTDDDRYARNYIRNHQTGKSKKRLIQDLKKKGVSDDLIYQAMEDENETDPKEQIMKLLRKKKFDLGNSDYEKKQKEKAKAFRFLASRGFEVSDITECVRIYQNEIEEP